jgi:hypothetical protein
MLRIGFILPAGIALGYLPPPFSGTLWDFSLIEDFFEPFDFVQGLSARNQRAGFSVDDFQKLCGIMDGSLWSHWHEDMVVRTN